MTASLRDQLLGAADRRPVPPFVLLLPAGWVSVEPTREVFAELAARASAVFRSVHRPDLDAQMRSMTERAADEFLRRDPVRLIYQERVPAELMLPLAITAVRATEPHGASLDGRVRALVRDHGARPLDDAGVVMRWVTDGSQELAGGRVATRSFSYLIPVPGTGRREALLFSAVLPTSAGEALDESSIAAYGVLVDAIMSTFRWSGA
jgi:hypothetical protein